MPYVTRDADGAISAVLRDDPGGAEFLSPGDPQLLDVLGSDVTEGSALSTFERLDVDFVRVLEDLIEALTSRNVINITDLPDFAQAKLFARKSYRERAGVHALRLFDSEDATRGL
jgi:hypothetical protein